MCVYMHICKHTAVSVISVEVFVTNVGVLVSLDCLPMNK